MGSLYRSEQMRFCQMIVQKDAAFACVAELGKQPYVQFKDLNADVNPFQRMFVRDIRRFDELERKLRGIEKEIRDAGVTIVDVAPHSDTYDVLPPHELNQLETTLVDLERDVNNMNESDILLKRNYIELREWEAILQKSEQFFQGGISDAAMQEIDSVEGEETNFATKVQEPVGFCMGVMNRDRVIAFERVIWRACRRTAFVRTSEIEHEFLDPGSGKSISKSVFITFYKGERLKRIIEKVCEGFQAKLFNNCPKTSKDREDALREVQARIQDLATVMAQTQEHRHRVVKAASYNYREWHKQVRMQKAVYQTLNLFTFDSIGKFFVAECWIPLTDLNDAREALERAVETQGISVKPVLNLLETAEEPPTYNKINKFTAVFQAIVNSYGVSSYLEVNPAPYTIITFPFIFACMFGDFGHGFIMFLAGLWLVVREENLISRNIKDEIFNMFFGGRYIILLMGLFSIHAGLLYNDAFAKSFNLFGSSWRNPYPTKKFEVNLSPYPSYLHSDGPYIFGIDPIWNLAENKLNFINSLKMKLSVIIGVSQMTLGVMLSLMNYRFFKSKIEIFTVFTPQLIFMSSIFIYLCLQIIIKWLSFWVREDVVFGNIYPGSHCAPSLLIGLINMFMFKDRVLGFVNQTEIISVNGNHTTYREYPNCYLGQWYSGQSAIESLLVVIALLCIPIMLFGKPIYFMVQKRKAKRLIGDKLVVKMSMANEATEIAHKTDRNGCVEEASGGESHMKHGDETLGDVIVHQAIHTIEYVLGCVSHTASYLRLWALSLAHAQLSEVLWDMVLRIALNMSGIVGYIALYFIFFLFGILSLCILVLMEGLSAFLHALRLHWVEFQSKFYLGLGYQFVPFYFKDVLARSSDI